MSASRNVSNGSVSAAKKKASTSVNIVHLYQELQKYPNLQLKQLLHKLSFSSSEIESSSLDTEITKIISDNEMGPFCSTFLKPFPLIHELCEKNSTKLAVFDDQISKAGEGLSQSDIVELMLSKAIYLCQIGDKDASISLLRQLEEKCPTTGARLDFTFAAIRIGLLWDDMDIVKRNISKTESLMELGGDWDRRNRLRVYKSIFYLYQRKFKEAAELLISSISTFNYTELMEFKLFVSYTVITGLLSLPRSEIKKKFKICTSPEVVELLQDMPEFKEYLSSFYECRYKDFFVVLATSIEDFMKKDVYLAAHSVFITREMRVKAYSQVLQSYKCVTLVALANAFGVSVEFMDKELYRWIAAGRLNCTIDKVSGIIENAGKEMIKNTQYQNLLKTSDALVSKIQRLSRVVHI